MNDNPVILKRNYINIPFGVYSLLEYFFHDEYNFSRPYIAKIGTEIVSTFEMLQEVVVASDTSKAVVRGCNNSISNSRYYNGFF